MSGGEKRENRRSGKWPNQFNKGLKKKKNRQNGGKKGARRKESGGEKENGE